MFTFLNKYISIRNRNETSKITYQPHIAKMSFPNEQDNWSHACTTLKAFFFMLNNNKIKFVHRQHVNAVIGNQGILIKRRAIDLIKNHF